MLSQLVRFVVVFCFGLPVVVDGGAVKAPTRAAASVQAHHKRAQGSDVEVEALRRWLHQAGGFIDRRLVVQELPGKGRGIVTLAHIQRDELLMWLPESRMLLARPDVTLSDEALLTMVHETQLEALASYPGVKEHLRPVARTAAHLAIEASRGAESAYHAYISSLPASCPPNLLSSGFGLQQWLQATPSRWIPNFHNITLQTVRFLLHGQRISVALQKWALCMVLSRAHSHSDFGVGLWPGLDMVNHVSMPSSATAKRWEDEPKQGAHAENRWDSYLTLHHASAGGRFAYGAGVGLAAAADLAPGDELLWPYTTRGNVELQAAYGFMDASDSATMFALQLPDSLLTTRNADSSLDWLASVGCYTDPEDLLTLTGIALQTEGMKSTLLRSAECIRRWIRGESRGQGKLPLDWTTRDIPILFQLSQSCEEAASAWIRSVALFPADIAEQPMASAAFHEGLAAERCVKHVRSTVARLSAAKAGCVQSKGW